MDLNTQKEMFSYAYVQAVASVAGYSVEGKSRPMDNAGIDLTIEVPGEIGECLFPKFDAQVKCTSSKNFISEQSIKFPLEVKNYKTLIDIRVLVPQILIVVFVPDDVTNWLNVSEHEILMKRCGYWVSLKGKPSTQNSHKITVELPRSNLFTPQNLSLIMEKIAKGKEL
ncbi:MAG: hypothetical protein AUK43_07485 [Oscillatoriales cyanobacterium CG2_30_40_61]|nr:MAG: hypothetical protein AUK43_07485 [Oscillatoriales cyanobacterium CG2_30_40_61]